MENCFSLKNGDLISVVNFCRQYKEQIRQQRQSESIYSNGRSSQKVHQNGGGEQQTTEIRHQHEVSDSNGIASSRVSREKMTKVSISGTKLSTTTRTTLQMHHNYHSQNQQQQQQQQPQQQQPSMDVKTMQKEAVLSYVKSKQQQQHSPYPHSSSSSSLYSQPRIPANNISQNGRSSSTTSIPQPNSGPNSVKSRRSEAEKSASAESHINQLRMVKNYHVL